MSSVLGAADYAVLGAYFVLMLGIGLFLAQKIKKYKDYFLAGGALTTPLLICTLVSTYYSLEVTFTTSEIAFDSGLVAWFWFSRPYYLAIFLAAFLITKRIKKFPFMTLPDLLEYRYGKTTRTIGAVACFVYSLPVLSISGMAIMFELLGWHDEKWVAVSFAVLLCGAYTVMGGLWADAITDTIQFVLMCVSLALAIPPALELVGGHEAIRSSLDASYFTSTGGVSSWVILSWAVVALTIFVEPSFYQRIFAAKSSKEVTKSLLIGVFLWAGYDWACTILGMAAKAAVQSKIFESTLAGNEALFKICIETLPVGLKGLFVAGLIAAVMSSVDSYCLLASGNLVYDIYRPICNPKIEDRKLIRLTRIGVFVVIGITVLVEMLFQKFADAWIFTASFLVAAILVPILGVLFAKPKKAAGFLSCLFGFISLVLFYVLIYTTGEFVETESSYRWTFGTVEIWRECATLFALPISLVGFILGQSFGKETIEWKSQAG